MSTLTPKSGRQQQGNMADGRGAGLCVYNPRHSHPRGWGKEVPTLDAIPSPRRNFR